MSAKLMELLNAAPWGGIDGELERVSEAWVAWPGGTVAINRLEEKSLAKIKRMVLRAPYEPVLRPYVAISGTPDKPKHVVEDLINNIRLTTRHAREHNVWVKWFDYPFCSVVIGDPNADKTWARLEIALPYKLSTEWPSLTVTKQEKPILYATVREMYDRMWDAATDPAQ